MCLKLESFNSGNTYDLDVMEIPPWYEAVLPILPNDIYLLNLSISDSSNNSIYIYMEPVFVVDNVTSISNPTHSVSSFGISSIYPNPFNSKTKIEVNLDKSNYLKSKIDVIDILGRKIKSFKGPFKPGNNTITWDGRNSQNENVASGIYFLTLRGGIRFYTKKLIMIR